MRALNLTLFDDLISGTSTSWTTPSGFDDELGKHDQIAVIAQVGDVSGTATLAVTIEHSADGQHWLSASGIPDIATALAPQSAYYGSRSAGLLGFVRLKVSLGGTAPACRLKLGVTCRDF